MSYLLATVRRMAAKQRDPLEDDAVIVRFGLMAVSSLRDSVGRCHATRGLYALSFFGENRMTVEEIARAAAAPHRWMRTTTHGALAALGHRLTREGPNNHLMLRFGREPSDADLEALTALFDAPRRNPHSL